MGTRSGHFHPFICIAAMAGALLGCGSNVPPAGLDPAPLPPEPVAEEVRPACPNLEALPAGDRVWFLHQEGVMRSVRVRVPVGYTPEKAWPVVLNLHGYTSSAEEQEGYAGMSAVADEGGFIALHPQGVNASELGVFYNENFRSWNAGPCCGVARDRNVDDVGFIRNVLDLVAESLCVDPKRVFSTGLSNGGFLSHRLACELSDRIAAIAPVAGVNGMDPCTPPRPVSVMQFHGTSDVLVPYEGNSTFPSVAQTMEGWAARNGCDPTPMETFNEGDTRCETWSGCDEEASVVLCTVDQGGHTWPGGSVPSAGGKTTQDIDATRAMWEFFKQHPRR